jgi:hypothetical protein
MAVPVVYSEGGDGEDIAVTYTIAFGESTPTGKIDDVEATPINSIVSLSNSYTLPVDEDFASLGALFSISMGDSNAQFIGLGTNGVQLALSTNPFTTTIPVDEDFAANGAFFTFIVGKSPLKALADNELPSGEGGPTTVQIWKTG